MAIFQREVTTKFSDEEEIPTNEVKRLASLLESQMAIVTPKKSSVTTTGEFKWPEHW